MRTPSVKLKTPSAAGMTIQRAVSRKTQAGPGKFQFEKVHFLFRRNITCNRQKA